jgi:stage V sporulation protein SpoVS
MLAPRERKRLLDVMVSVYAEHGYKAEPGASPGDPALFAGAFAGVFNDEEEALVAAINAALAKIVSAVSVERMDVEPPAAVVAGTLGGAEMVARGEILAGHAERLPWLLADFGYLVTLPFLGDAEARRVSQRAREMLTRTMEEQGKS